MKKVQAEANHKQDFELCKQILQTFQEDGEDRPKYMEILQEVANRKKSVIEILLDDVAAATAETAGVFAERITRNTERYLTLFCKAVDELMPQPTESIEGKGELFDTFMEHRVRRHRKLSGRADEKEKDVFPPELFRRYELRIIPLSSDKPLKFRDVRAKSIGALVTLKGIVTKTSEVLPLTRVATYVCGVCGVESYQTVNAKTYMPLVACPSTKCKQNESQGKLTQLTRGSKLVRYQEIKVQEPPEEVPMGAVPRSLKVRAFGELARTMKPGDIVNLSGIFLPTPFVGFRAIRAGLTADTYLLLMRVQQQKKTYTEFRASPELEAKVEEAAEEKDIYENLAASIAPEIYGHRDIKKALVCLLVGGVTRVMPDGMKIRGDVNVLLMGDPGVAKSQLLKHIAHVAPRGIYTTGKGSSGVGLTAAVIRDQVTGEMALEGGALVLADMGICCIDEFDKMEEGDRTAIHEVMEQQTVSIAKAGITTTLNARTAVLAAANPVFGRWNKRVSAEKNLGLPTALLSRFDLTFIILDKPDEGNDEALARHVTYVHRESKHPPLEFEPFSPAFIRAYIARAKQYNPWVPPDLTDFIVGSYVGLRKESDEKDMDMKQRTTKSSAGNRQGFCTARSLLGILRLSQALARLHFRNEVKREDVEEAMRLLEASKMSANESDEKKTRGEPVTEIFKIIRKYQADKKLEEFNVSEIQPAVIRAGYSEDDLRNALMEYETLEVWTLSRDGETIRFNRASSS